MKDIQITMEPDGWMEKTGGYAKDMTLRDYFAAKAMEGMIGLWSENSRHLKSGQTLADFVAEQAYAYADAMLEAGK